MAIRTPLPIEKKYIDHPNLEGKNIKQTCSAFLDKATDLKAYLLASGKNPDFFEKLNLYNEIFLQLDGAMSLASLFSQVHPEESVRKDAEDCEQKASDFLTDLSLDKNIYQMLKEIDANYLDSKAQRMLTHTLRDFKRSGVDKDEETRFKLKSLNQELVTLGQEFGQNIIKDRLTLELKDKSDLKGLPQDYIDAHKPDQNGKITISTDYPDYIPFMTYAESTDNRRNLRKLFLSRGQDNASVLKDLIAKRYEKAQLLGYSSYADYVVEDKMIKNAKAIEDFIGKITALAKPGADKEYAQLLDFKRKYFGKSADKIQGYESGFLEEKYKKEHFGFDSQKAREYFSYNQVKQGVLDTTSKLFNIKYVHVPNASVWHKSVDTYDVYDETGKIGRVYLDMHPREGKYKHAAQFTVRSGLNDRQYPEGALVCNFPEPSENDPNALMEHDQVVTFFHEFGHLLHHIFAGKQDWVMFSGVATEWDFVEAPSQLLEEWAWDYEVLASFAKHYKTGQSIEKSLVEKMKQANEFGKALAARQQMFYAALSLNYYNLDPKTFEPLSLLKKLQPQYSYYPYEEGTHFCYNFGHLDGYSAMYYTYMWSLSWAKDLMTPFMRDGLMSQDNAIRYRDTILKPGGSKDASELVQDFLGRRFSFDAFEGWLSPENTNIALGEKQAI